MLGQDEQSSLQLECLPRRYSQLSLGLQPSSSSSLSLSSLATVLPHLQLFPFFSPYPQLYDPRLSLSLCLYPSFLPHYRGLLALQEVLDRDREGRRYHPTQYEEGH